MTQFQKYINEIMEKAVNNDDLDRIRYKLVFDRTINEADEEFLTRLTYLVGAWYNSRRHATMRCGRPKPQTHTYITAGRNR